MNISSETFKKNIPSMANIYVNNINNKWKFHLCDSYFLKYDENEI